MWVDYSNSLEQNYHKKLVRTLATDSPFKDNTFDLICCYNVLEFISELELALEEMLRVIRGGHIFLLPHSIAVHGWQKDTK